MDSRKLKAPKMKEHDMKSGMIDNRKVNDSHQRGAERIMGIGKSMSKGQGGKMSSSAKADFSRSSAMTPRKA